MFKLALPIFLFSFFDTKPKSISFDLNRKQVSIHGKEITSPMTVSLCLGMPRRQCFDVGYDTGAYLLWLPDQFLNNQFEHYYNWSESSTFILTFNSIITEKTDCYVMGSECQDTLSFTNLDEQIAYFFSFILVDCYQFEIKAEGYLGLARNYTLPFEFDSSKEQDSNRFSFIDFLFGVNMIDKKVFYHKYSSDSHGKLVIGEDIKLSSGEYLFECQCIDSEVRRINDFWNCKMSSYTVDNIEVITDNQYSIFSTSEESIISPYLLGYKIIEEYREIAASSSECSITYLNGLYQLVCSIFNYTSTIPSISFKFGEYVLRVSTERLFKFIDDFLVFQIKARQDRSYWIIGEAALRNQGMVFNHQTNTVGFISQTQIPKSYYLSNYFIVITSICLGMLLFYAFQLYCKYRKERSICRAVEEAKQSFDLTNLG